MNKAIIEFISHLKDERQYALNTQISYERDLIKLMHFLQTKQVNHWSELSADLLNLFMMQLRRQNISPRSIRRHLSSVRGLLAYLVNQGQLEENCAIQLATPKPSQNLPSALSYEELLLMLKPQSNSASEYRDVAMIEVLYSCGLRISELVGLNLADVDLEQGFLSVMGKGSKTRHTPLGKSAIHAINKHLNNHNTKALFTNKSSQRISTRSVQNIIKKRALNAGIKINVHPHMLRHAAATHFLQSSHDLRTTQEFLGHKSIKSTQVYTHLDFLELSKVYDKCHPRAKK